jgi:hypothetical protein
MSFCKRRAWLIVFLLGGLLAGYTGLERPATNHNASRLAPEIVGTDAEGQTFKLSDYRGKVVMLEFWREI